ncbi:MAG TPA: nuclear transport factor 2 family protein [Candidatus Dormibacteraeota bacterium]|nr:nuclear transport factor 2 family protein [Candidatus Dormibacteraeota bacterium]
MTDDVSQRLAALERRLQAVEDELAIHRLIVRYGLAVDTGDAPRTAAVFAEDGIYDADVRLMRGRGEVEDMVRSDRHQEMVGRCAHQIGPAVVKVDGDRAVALGYSRVYLRGEDGIDVYRVSMNRWELERRGGAWLIARRLTRLLGHDEAAAIFAEGLSEV